jgi:hypothetical protein
MRAQYFFLEAAASNLGRQIVIVKAGTESEIDRAFATIVEARAKRAVRRHRCVLQQPAPTNSCAGSTSWAACELPFARVRRRRWSDELRCQ